MLQNIHVQFLFCNIDAICTSANIRRFSQVTIRHKKHRPVPGRSSSGAQTDISRFVKRFSKVPGAFQTFPDGRF